jgi:two-component system response regulator FlrC
VDFRVIATTNRDIEAEVREGAFRQDLFFRLNVIPVHIPALRERPADILPLAEHFINKIARREGLNPKSLSTAAKAAILGYNWPGNVRELENVIERAMILADGQEIDAGDILLSARAPQPTSLATPGQTIHEMEKNLIMSTLNQVDGNRTRAAELLGISIRTLRNKLNEYKQGGQISDTEAD